MPTPVPRPPASKPEDIQRFIESKDLSLLSKPLVFEKTEKVNSYTQGIACAWCWLSGGLTGLLWPVCTCCPGKIYDHYHLEVDQNGVRFAYGENDICCNVAVHEKVVPFQEIKHTSLVTGCCMTSCCGLQQVVVSNGVQDITVHVSSNGNGGTSAHVETHEAVEAAFLKEPYQAYRAIQAAVESYKERMVPPKQVVMIPGPGMPVMGTPVPQ